MIPLNLLDLLYYDEMQGLINVVAIGFHITLLLRTLLLTSSSSRAATNLRMSLRPLIG